MNSQEIRDILVTTVPTTFQTTVVPADKLGTVKSQQFAIIANSDRSDQPGMHWVALFKQRNSPIIEFFDSCAMPIEFYDSAFMKFLHLKGRVTRSSKVRIQSLSSNVCGQYCIYYLIHRVKGVSFENVLQMFNENDLESNDSIVREFVRVNFGMQPCRTNINATDSALEETKDVINIIQCCMLLEDFIKF